MKQHVVNDQVAARYAEGIDHVWSTWEPSLRRCERMLGGRAWRDGFDGEELSQHLRRAQYRAHTAAEFAAGLVPPPSAVDAHTLLIGILGGCRDTLGVIAVRADLGELDEDVAEIGLHSVDATRDAFRGARASTALVHAWVADDQVDPEWLDRTPAPASRFTAAAVWILAAACLLLFAGLLLQVFVFAPS